MQWLPFALRKVDILNLNPQPVQVKLNLSRRGPSDSSRRGRQEVGGSTTLVKVIPQVPTCSRTMRENELSMNIGGSTKITKATKSTSAN